MVAADLLVFDMDGVLVDVAESYRETIVQTVRHFSGRDISRDLIQDYKNQGGWNNDWALSQRILHDMGLETRYDTVVEEFNKLFLGTDGTPGLVNRERWIGGPGLFERLALRYQLAIFSGRHRYEADITLLRYAAQVAFNPIICADDVILSKPDPEGLLKIAKLNPGKQMLYFGDVLDDARSARAARVPFVGVVARGHSRRDEVFELFRAEQAIAIIDDVNQIESVLK